MSADTVYEFGRFRLEPRQRRLVRDGTPVPLTPKAFDTLVALVSGSGAVVDKDDLLRAVWPDTVVEEGNLTQSVSVLRKALGDSSGDRRYIATVPGRGYQFVCEVICHTSSASSAARGDLEKSQPPAGRPVPRSLAVLPFTLLDASAIDEYLPVGLADALITRLGNIQTITVRPTSAILSFARAPFAAADAARVLDVDAVLEGTIRRAGDRIRVTAQLVLSSAAAPVWAGKFDDDFTDLFTIEDRLSDAIAAALKIRLTRDEHRQLTWRHTQRPEAYQAYLRGLFFLKKGTSSDALKAVEHLTWSLEVDRELAPAAAALAEAYTVLSHFAWEPRVAMPKAKEAALRALELNPHLGDAHYALALVKMWYDRDWRAAEERFRCAIQLNASHVMAHTWYSLFLTAMSRFDEALAHLKRAESIDPLSPLSRAFTGWSLYMMRRFDEASDHFREALELEPAFQSAWWGLGWSHVWTGAPHEAVSAFEKVHATAGESPEILAGLSFALARSRQDGRAADIFAALERLGRTTYVSPFYLALAHAGAGHRDRALELLGDAIDDRCEWVIQMAVDPAWDFLRDDARFDALLARLDLVPQVRAD